MLTFAPDDVNVAGLISGEKVGISIASDRQLSSSKGGRRLRKKKLAPS